MADNFNWEPVATTKYDWTPVGDSKPKLDSYKDILSTPKQFKTSSDDAHATGVLSTYYGMRDGQPINTNAIQSRVELEFGEGSTPSSAVSQLRNTFNVESKGAPPAYLKTREGYFSNPLMVAGKSFAQIAKSAIGSGGLAFEQMFGGGKEFKTPFEERAVERVKGRTKAAQDFIDQITPESWVEAEEAVGAELSENDVGFFRTGFLLLAQNMGNLGVAATTPPPVAFASMFSTERQSMADELSELGLNRESVEGASSLFGMVSAPIEYIENIGRLKGGIGEKGVKALTKPVQRAVAGMLKNAGMNVGEELTQKLAHDLVYNMAITEHNESTGDSVPLLDLADGTGETVRGSLAMSTVLDAMGLPVRSARYKSARREQLRDMRSEVMESGGEDVLTEPITAGEAKQYGQMLSDEDINELYEQSEQSELFQQAIRGDSKALSQFNQNIAGGEVAIEETTEQTAPPVARDFKEIESDDEAIFITDHDANYDVKEEMEGGVRIQILEEQDSLDVMFDESFTPNPLSKDPLTPEKIYNNYAKTREHIRSKYGDTITLYRAQGTELLIENKNVLNFATEEFAGQFLRDDRSMISREVPVEDIVGVVINEEGYHEFKVLNHESNSLKVPQAPAQEAPADEATSESFEDSPVESVNEAPLTEISDKAQKILSLGEKVKGVVKPFVSLTTRIKEIAPKVALKVRESKQKAHLLATERTQESETFAKSTKDVIKSLPKEERNTLKAEILNGDWEALSRRGIKGVQELRQMFSVVASDLGIKETRDNYFRRQVKDYDGLVKHLGKEPRGVFKKAIDDLQQKKGRELTQEEKNQAVRNALSAGGGDGLKQRRSIEVVTPEMAEFYGDPLDVLNDYIRQTSQVIARKEALGIDTKLSDEFGETEDLAKESITSIVTEMVGENVLDKKQENELKDLLKSELTQKGAPKAIQAVQKLASLKYVTKLKTVVKQMGDVFAAIGENGIENVLGSAEADKWMDQFGSDTKVSLEAAGVNTLDAELQSSKRRVLEDWVFKPLQLADVAGKTILLKSTARKWHTMSKSDPTKLKSQLMRKFEHEGFVDSLIEDMQGDVMSGDVTFALYSQMADFHPVSHSEHIKFYIDNPNMRMLFILKSFAFKRFDRLYREAIGPTIDGMAKHMAGFADNNQALMKEGADDFAFGILGLSRFLIFSIAGEALIDKMYKEAMQAAGFAPEEPPEEESFVNEYLEELGRIAPFIDAFSLKKAIERRDPQVYWEEAFDVPTPIGLDTISSLGKKMAGKDDTSWTKDIPWLGEFLSGKEKVRKASGKTTRARAGAVVPRKTK